MLSAAERRWAWSAALLIMAAVSLPYLLLAGIAPDDTVFWPYLNNPDDHAVYVAWMRQAEQGGFFFQNLYTGEEQRALTVNLFFWVLGSIARFTHLPLVLIDHLARVGFGALLLVLVYQLAAFFTEDRRVRRAAFGFVAFSSGLGWVFWPPERSEPTRYPVDTWQPEAITFLSLYANALFCAGMAAMVGLFLCLLLAQRTGRWCYVPGAGGIGFLLGNFHSYDVIAIAAVWAVYLLTLGVATRRAPVQELRQAVVAALIAAPSVLYQYYLLQADPVFAARAAVPTPSPPPHLYLLGYGLLVPLAAVGAWRLLRLRIADCGLRIGNGPNLHSAIRNPQRVGPEVCFPLVWAIVGLAVLYLPFAFQRKLAEGLHIPIAMLAAFGAAAVAGRFVGLRMWGQRRRTVRNPQSAIRNPQLVVLSLLLLTMPTNLRFIYRDWKRAIDHNVGSTGLHAVFWPKQDVEAMRRLDEWVPSFGLVQALPMTSSLIPAMSGRRVWAGHWGETPGFGVKFGEALRFFRPETSSDWRRQFLARTRITHVFVGAAERELSQGTLAQEPFLRLVHRLEDTLLYQVVPDGR
jgi:hypothetical protein